MGEPAFDAADYVRFDLAAGAIGTRDGDNMVLVPRELLGSCAEGAGLAAAARAVGETRGLHFASWAATSSGTEPLGIDALAKGIDGAIAVLGFGRTELDIRGDALVFRIRSAPESVASGGLLAFLGAFLAGFVSAIVPDMRFEVAHLGPSAGADGEAVFFAGNPGAAARLSRWIADGEAPYAALERLHREGGPA